MTLFIKNMVCLRCIICVKTVLEKLGIEYEKVSLGEVVLANGIHPPLYSIFQKELEAMDLFIIENRKSIIIENIKHAILSMTTRDEPPRENYSAFISNHVGSNYTYLANLFSHHEGITIEHYIILKKIDKVKELLLQTDLTLTEISYKLHYSSVAHLSSQFKKITGITTSQFRQAQYRNP